MVGIQPANPRDTNFNNAVVLKCSELFPGLRFDLRYCECGLAFKGRLLAKGGEVLAQQSGTYQGNRGG